MCAQRPLLATQPWTNYTSSLLLIGLTNKMGIFSPFTHRIFEIKNETLCFVVVVVLALFCFNHLAHYRCSIKVISTSQSKKD